MTAVHSAYDKQVQSSKLPKNLFRLERIKRRGIEYVGVIRK
ncbi:MAG: hypothetical protein ABSF82_08570 [Candidatus Bathyarchaeia archaeon]